MAVIDILRAQASSTPRAVHLACLTEANEALRAAKRSGVPADIAAAQRRLHDAVDAARDAGVEWMAIGDVLGLARGNAYQKFRRRPEPSGIGHP